MAALDAGPCQEWPTICDEFPVTGTAEQLELIDLATIAATEALWTRTKKRFGLCTVTIRPCKRECWPLLPPTYHDATSWGWPFPMLIGGTWVNLGCSSCGDSCSCTAIHEVRLPYPVAAVTEVKVDGVVLASSNYRVDDYRWLVRVDGQDWPTCNDLNKADTEVGTWSVTVQYGEPVPILGQLAAGQLASEIYKGCAGSGAGDCKLPMATVKQITRQGVTKVFFDADSAFKNGKIGLYYPDLFIKTYNPSGTGRTSIYDIDGAKPRRAGT